MSREHYNLQWQEAINDLLEQLQIENYPLQQNKEQLGINYIRSDLELFQHYVILYIKYISCYKKLEDCYDQMVHPQKRILLKKMLETTMVRMIQTKNLIIQFNRHGKQPQCDFVNLDEILMSLKLSPDTLEIPFPRYFKDFSIEKDKIKQLVNKYLESIALTAEPEEEQFEDRTIFDVMLNKNAESESQRIANAIKQIIKYESGRQGIIQTKIAQFKFKQEQKKEEKRKLVLQGLQNYDELNKDSMKVDAITIVQKYFRGYQARKVIFERRMKELQFLGIEKEEKEFEKQEKKKYDEVRAKMKFDAQENQNEYENVQDELKEQIKTHDGPDILEQMEDERRKWIFEYLDQHEQNALPNDIQEFYDRQNVMPPLTPEQEELQKQAEDAAAKKKKDAKKGKKGKKTDQEEFLDQHKLLDETKELKNIQDLIQSFDLDWCKKDETKNFKQKHDIEMAKAKVRPLVEQELQQQADQVIGIELINYALRFLKKGKKKKKKGKKKKKKSKEPKRKKIPGQARNKDKRPEDMLAELVESGILKKLMPAKIDDLLGDHKVLGSLEEKQYDDMPDPSMAQLRSLIKENIGIPLGSEYAKSQLKRMNYYLFFGPQGSGKTLAVRGIANECDALLFDISPQTLSTTKYLDSKQETDDLLFKVFNCATTFQPAVIYFDETEYIFKGAAGKKKKGGNANANPLAGAFARIKKPLMQIKKAKYFFDTDRVAVIGNTNKPYFANVKDCKLFFEKSFYFPYPNYSTRKLLLEQFISSKGILIPYTFPMAALAHYTEGWTGGSFKLAIDKILNNERLKNEKPLELPEFINPLALTYCTGPEEYKEFQKFNDIVTGLKDRKAILAKQREEADPKKGKGKGGKGKKK